MARTGFAFPLSFHTSLVVEVAQAAEAQGYASFWLTEGGGKDAISQLAYVAAHTERIGLATGIITIFSRTPALVAQTAHGMAQLSGGRFILGLGTGHKASVEDGQGLPFSKPISRMEDYVAVLRQVLREGPRPTRGQGGQRPPIFEFRIGADEPLNGRGRSTSPPSAGRGPQLAGRVAEGVVPLLASPMGIGALREDIVNGARSAGRDLSDVRRRAFHHRRRRLRLGPRRASVARQRRPLRADALLSEDAARQRLRPGGHRDSGGPGPMATTTASPTC